MRGKSKVVTRMETLESGWTHYVYYTPHQMMRVQVYITLLCIYCILERGSFDVLCNKHNVSNLIFLRYPF